MAIYMWREYVNPRRGPCDNGFHIPTKDERNNVYSIWKALGGGASDAANFRTALKLPLSGYRQKSNSNVTNQTSSGNYRTCTASGGLGYYLFFNASSTIQVDSTWNADGYTIRGFKDFPTTPTNSRTKLYGTSIAAGGIFWDSENGLISLSSDGTTWITIADKNLGATSADVSSANSYGYYYQWGNNYGFPNTGNVTKNSTQVDVSAYGPGNYYSSSTFITRNSSPYCWNSSNNTNLRGGDEV